MCDLAYSLPLKKSLVNTSVDLSDSNVYLTSLICLQLRKNLSITRTTHPLVLCKEASLDTHSHPLKEVVRVRRQGSHNLSLPHTQGLPTTASLEVRYQLEFFILLYKLIQEIYSHIFIKVISRLKVLRFLRSE